MFVRGNRVWSKINDGELGRMLKCEKLEILNISGSFRRSTITKVRRSKLIGSG